MGRFKQVTTPAPDEAKMPDPLADKIAGAMQGMHNLREENAVLYDRVSKLELECTLLKSERACLQAQLDGERAERRHYHSLANEIITRLDIVGRTVDDVVQRAQHEVYSKRKELNGRVEVPELQIPAFLKQPIPEIPSTNGTEQ